MASIAKLGCRWCIEHVGTPNANLDYIHQLPLYALKLNQTIVRNIAPENETGLFVRALVATATNSGLLVLADGVENQEEWKALSALNVNGGQGYWLGKPEEQLLPPQRNVKN